MEIRARLKASRIGNKKLSVLCALCGFVHGCTYTVNAGANERKELFRVRVKMPLLA